MPIAPTAPRPSVLVVEDDDAVAGTLVDLLESSHYRVRRAASGAEARALMAQAKPDLVTLDLNLPDMDGLLLCPALKQLADVPVLVCSALSGSRDRVLALKLGADDYVTKPFDIFEVEARVEALLRRAARKRQRQAADHATVGVLRPRATRVA